MIGLFSIIPPTMAKRKSPAELSAEIKRTKTAASEFTAFNSDELDNVIQSLHRAADIEFQDSIDWIALRALFEKVAHEPHKDWTKTEHAAEQMSNLISDPQNPIFRSIFKRVLEGGCWESSRDAATKKESSRKPWVVLVTGLNGIRKTTSVYQPWFKTVLREALDETYQHEDPDNDLPDGQNSFFRQLDFMIATCCNVLFEQLYEIDDLEMYSAMKAGIFSRYRKLAEMLGVLLMKSAQKEKMDVMLETSGRDIAMFQYVDHFFADETYRKLVLHFEINDLSMAECSVDGESVSMSCDGQRR
jgi:hypothetical protein